MSTLALSAALVWHKVIMVGSGRVGKTSITLRFMYDDFIEEYDPVRAETYCRKVTFGGNECQINILDTVGQKNYTAIRDSYIRNSEGFVCVFSVTEDSSFQACQQFRDQIISTKNNESVPLILVGNKCDLMDSRQVSKMQAQKCADDWDVSYVETSAKTSENVDKVFFDLLRDIHASKSSKIVNGEHIFPKSPKKKKCILL